MPLNSDGEGSEGSTTPSMFGSISSLAGSGMKSLTGSKAAQRGLFRGKALLSSAWASMSPQTTKNLSSLKSGLSSAATNLSKRYEEMTATPEPGAASEVSGDMEDRVSQSSTDSRRQSEAVQVDGIPQGESRHPRINIIELYYNSQLLNSLITTRILLKKRVPL